MSAITNRIDNLTSTPILRKILFLTGIGWLFDAMDQGMVSGVMAAIGIDWDLSTAQTGWLGSAGMLGMFLGAALSGIASDKWGRRTVIMYTLIIYGVASGLSGFATSYEMLIVLRFVTGFGLGGELPAASTLISEISPTKIRGRNVIILESFWAWGWIAAALVANFMIPVWGWRVAFWVGAVPALFAAVLRKMVPESPRYLEINGRAEEADALVSRMEEQARSKAKKNENDIAIDENQIAILTESENLEMSETSSANDSNATDADQKKKPRVSFKELWSRKYIRSTCVLWTIWFGMNFGYYGFVLWTPSLLVDKGFDLTRSFQFTLIMCIAQLPGYFSAAYLVEKIGRKPVLAVYFMGTAISAWFFGNANSETAIMVCGCLIYFFSLGAWGCVYAYTPEVYPTAARGSGTGWASAFGRVGAFIAPMIVPVMYSAFGKESGLVYVFAILTAVFAIVAIVVLVFGKETMGKPLIEEND